MDLKQYQYFVSKDRRYIGVCVKNNPLEVSYYDLLDNFAKHANGSLPCTSFYIVDEKKAMEIMKFINNFEQTLSMKITGLIQQGKECSGKSLQFELPDNPTTNEYFY